MFARSNASEKLPEKNVTGTGGNVPAADVVLRKVVDFPPGVEKEPRVRHPDTASLTAHDEAVPLELRHDPAREAFVHVGGSCDLTLRHGLVWVQKQPSGNPGASRSKRVRRTPPTLEPVRSPHDDHTQARRHQVRVAREVEPADLSLLASLSTDLSHVRNRNQGNRPGSELPHMQDYGRRLPRPKPLLRFPSIRRRR